MNFNPLFAKFLSHGRPIAPPRLWSRYTNDYDVWYPPQNEADTIKSLMEKHGRDDLVDSGLAVIIDRKIQFNPILFGMQNHLLPLRTLPEHSPFNLMTSEGNIRGKFPLLAAAADYRVRANVAETGTLFLAETLGDVARLRALGIAVAPVFGLERLTAKNVHDFRIALGQSPKCSQFAVVQKVVLVGWSPTTCSRHCPRIIYEVAHSLGMAADCLGLPPQNLLLWRPTCEDLSKLHHCLNLGTKHDVLQVIGSSVESSSRPIGGSPTDGHFGAELLTAEKKLRAVLRAPSTRRRRRQKEFRRHERRMEAELVKPILDAAQETEDPVERVRLYGLAQAARALSMSSIMHQAKLESEIITHGLDGSWADLDLNGLLKSLEAVIKLCKEED